MANHKNLTMPSKQAAASAAGIRNNMLVVYGWRYVIKQFHVKADENL